MTETETTMERRRSKRVNFSLKAQSIHGEKKFNGVIGNFSKEGIFKIIPEKNLVGFIPGMEVIVTFQTPQGHNLHLNCEIKWLQVNLNLPHGLKYHLGMEIKNPPQGYEEFVQTLYEEGV
jgi:hypothetical protein